MRESDAGICMSTIPSGHHADSSRPPGLRPLGLGIDAGGTQTRWALALPSGELVAEGHADGFSALQMSSAIGRERIGSVLALIASAVKAVGRPAQVVAGVTGFADNMEGENLAALIAESLGISRRAVSLCGDMEIAYLDLFAPGDGYLVYAGTGSIAAFIDAANKFHRIGGHGSILDDAGSGFWIAIEALRHIWRAEDERPGGWRESAMAREVFARIGSSDWSASREFLYRGGFETNRGNIGQLALAVAASATTDPVARHILIGAGAGLARLAATLTARFGTRPIALAGRVAALHPLIEASMRATLPATSELAVRVSAAHHAAARIAARNAAENQADDKANNTAAQAAPSE